MAPAWLGIALAVLQFFKRKKPKAMRKLIDPLEYVVDLVGMEEKYGDLGMWDGLKEAEARGNGYSMTPQQVAQMNDFKGIFDKNLKKPLGEASEFLQDSRAQAIIEALFGDDD